MQSVLISFSMPVYPGAFSHFPTLYEQAFGGGGARIHAIGIARELPAPA